MKVNVLRSVLALLFLGLFLLSTNTPDAGLGPLVLVAVYLLPTVIAAMREKRHPGPVIVVNVLLGWTVIGWIIALAMAAGGDTRADVARAAART